MSERAASLTTRARAVEGLAGGSQRSPRAETTGHPYVWLTRQCTGMQEATEQITLRRRAHLELVADGLVLSAVNVSHIDLLLTLEGGAKLAPVFSETLTMTCRGIGAAVGSIREAEVRAGSCRT